MSSRKNGEQCVHGVAMLCKYCNQKRVCPDSEYEVQPMLFGYRIFCGLLAGVLVDTSWENARDRVREYYKNDKRYLGYWEKQKELFEDDDEPMIEIYDLSERFEDDANCIFELVI